MNNKVKRLIITDNKAMATTIAHAIGYSESDAGQFFYDGLDDEVVWTGGEFLRLIPKKDAAFSEDSIPTSAEGITRKFFNVCPRLTHGEISYVDAKRIRFIEDALGYCDEVIFICQPTTEGERIIQSVKAFFDVRLPTGKIMLDEFNQGTVAEAIEAGIGSQKFAEYNSLVIMTQLLRDAFGNKERVPTAHSSLSAKEYLLLRKLNLYINKVSNSTGYINEVRSYPIGGVIDLTKLYAAMSHKYFMAMDSMWESLVYLYAEGLISNPMIHLLRKPDTYTYFGDGNPRDDVEYSDTDEYIATRGGIYPVGRTNEPMLALAQDYDHENHPEDFYTRTAAIYRFVVEQKECVKRKDRVERFDYVSFKEHPGISVAEISLELYSFREWFRSFSVSEALGTLIERLSDLDLIEYDDGLINLTVEGKVLADKYIPA